MKVTERQKLNVFEMKYLRSMTGVSRLDRVIIINNKIWILFAMSAYSFDEPKFTSAREKRKEKENNKQKHQKFTMHNLPEQ